MTLILRRASSSFRSSSSSDNYPLRYQPPSSPLSSLLSSCKSLRHLQHLHAHIVRKGLHQHHILISQLLSLCNSLSETRYATSIFNHVSHPNIYLWNSILKGLARRKARFGSARRFIALF
ncbi:hypothetical protein AAC387_Pa10g1527 [Persea americana]